MFNTRRTALIYRQTVKHTLKVRLCAAKIPSVASLNRSGLQQTLTLATAEEQEQCVPGRESAGGVVTKKIR